MYRKALVDTGPTFHPVEDPTVDEDEIGLQFEPVSQTYYKKL